MNDSYRKHYDAELLELDTRLARMGQAACGAIEQAMAALKNGDTALARQVVAGDREINAAEHAVEHQCLSLILRQQPVAGDLRRVSTALKMVTDIERMGDQASDIAEIVLHLDHGKADTVGVTEEIQQMGGMVLKMAKDAVAAFVQADLAEAVLVKRRDDAVDEAFCRVAHKIAGHIAADPAGAECALDLFMIAKYLERLGDHAVNVAEWVEFLKTGVHKSERIV